MGQVNSTDVAEEMAQQLEHRPTVQMRVRRHAMVFNLRIEKHGGTLGLVCKKPKGSPLLELLVVEALRGGGLAKHNNQQAAAGCWGAVVLPRMFVVAVNGVGDDIDAMAHMLQVSDAVELQVRRSRTSYVEPQRKALRVVQAAHALEGGVRPEAGACDADHDVSPLTRH